MSQQELTKDILDNQVHGGMIICENVRNVFHAVSQREPPQFKKGTAEIQVDILLLSLPSDEAELIKPQIKKVKMQFSPWLKEIKDTWTHRRPGTPSARSKLEDEEIELKQLQSLMITQLVIDYLKSIGQWWNKRQSVPVSIVNDADSDIEPEEHFNSPV
jgi:hypothetical protein